MLTMPLIYIDHFTSDMQHSSNNHGAK